MSGLTTRAQTSGQNVQSTVFAALDRRLDRAANAPIALGLSGGGDSVALALLAADWARQAGRKLHILTVDHGLSPASPDWTLTCRHLAQRLGAEFQALSWEGPRPTTGLPAAARRARHGLLAEAARKLGARVILLGHTANDRAEGAIMRQTGSTTPDPREWSPSPVWPQGRSVFLLRPMLTVSRQALRDWLSERAEPWIEDPANTNLQFARSRARAVLPTETPVAPLSGPQTSLCDLARQMEHEYGFCLDRSALRTAPYDAARTLVGIACLCAAGSERPPRADRLTRLVEHLRGSEPVIATLAGARIEADSHQVRWMRNVGDLFRHGTTQVPTSAGSPVVWDGRYVLTTNRSDTVEPLQGKAAVLSSAQRAALRRWSASARGALPFMKEDRSCPTLESLAGTKIVDLAPGRYRAACGLCQSEQEI